MTGGLNVGPGSSSVTVQLEPAGMPLWVTLWDPVTCTWYAFVGFVQVIVKWNTVDCWLAGAVFSIVTEPGASELVTVTVTVWPAPTVNAPAGSMNGGLKVEPGLSSVTVQLDPAGMPLWVTLSDP